MQSTGSQRRIGASRTSITTSGYQASGERRVKELERRAKDMSAEIESLRKEVGEAEVEARGCM